LLEQPWNIFAPKLNEAPSRTGAKSGRAAKHRQVYSDRRGPISFFAQCCGERPADDREVHCQRA